MLFFVVEKRKLIIDKMHASVQKSAAVPRFLHNLYNTWLSQLVSGVHTSQAESNWRPD